MLKIFMDLVKKPPIIVVLGHVDHGKTSLLDYIRKTNVALKEAGGITQKIGAYEIEYKGEKMTFIDTPGHEAFAMLRQRGAKFADIGILVIAADEGVKEQTKESLEYLKIFKIPFIIALNKIDKKDADPEKVLAQLVELEVIPEKWGGEIPTINVSAKTGEGIDDLLETIILLRDIYEMKTKINGLGRGYILEAFKDPKRGILASLIVTEGVVKLGDFLITQSSLAKIKIMEDDLGRKINEAYPSKPILVGNFDVLPSAGEEFKIGQEKDIENIRKELEEKEKTYIRKHIFVKTEEKGDYVLIVRADHLGSLEALENIFLKLSQKLNTNIKIIKQDLGPISLEDVELAKEFGAIILSFNVKNFKNILDHIKNLNIKFIESNVIYELEEKLESLVKGEEIKELLPKGELEVLATFSKTKTKKTIGGRVVLGRIKLKDKVIILRNGEIMGRGKIISLEKNKILVEEVKENELCGLIIETTKDIEINDIIRIE